MSYSTIDDQKNEVPYETIRQLVDDENVGSLSGADVLARFNQIRDDWEGEMNAMLELGGYTTPITSPEAALNLLRGWSKGGTAYKLYKRKDIMPETRQKEFERINKLLEKVSQGAFKLPEKPVDIDTSFVCGSLVTSHFGEETT